MRQMDLALSWVKTNKIKEIDHARSCDWRGFESASCLLAIFVFFLTFLMYETHETYNVGNEDKLKPKYELARKVRQPGIEPGSIAWKATMLTFTPPTPWQHSTRGSWIL